MFTWFSGFRMRFFAAKGLATDVSDVWTKIGGNFTDAFKVASTGDDDKQYFVPIYIYPWAVFYRKSVFSANSWTPPTTLDEFKALADKMKTANLIPLAFGDKDGWPAMGTFDILNLRKNGYQFHVDLMAGKQKWTDAKVKDVFTLWQSLLPYMQDGAAGRTWQDAAQALVQKKAGMYLLGMFVSQQFQTAGAADLADLDFFPFPNLGTTFDAEKALDAPIDGLMISSKSPTPGGGPHRFEGVPGVHRPAEDPGRLGDRGPEQHRSGQERRHVRLHRPSRRRPPSSSARPRRSPSSSTATRTPTSPAPTGCRRSCSTSSRRRPRISTRC